MNCPVSVWIDYYYDLPVEQAVTRLHKAGFRYGELSDLHMDQLMERGAPAKTGSQLKAHCDSLGYTICQAHTRFSQGLAGETALDMLKADVDLFAALGVENAIVHVAGNGDMEQAARYAGWMENLNKISRYARGSGVTLCLENLMLNESARTAQGLLKVMEDAAVTDMGICLDTGHLHFCNCQGLATQSQGDFIRAAGSKLRALHINDNNGERDTHQMPFSARTGVDWVDVMRGLHDIDYKGLFNLEIVGEWHGTDVIKEAKLAFAQILCSQLLSDEFVA